MLAGFGALNALNKEKKQFNILIKESGRWICYSWQKSAECRRQNGKITRSK